MWGRKPSRPAGQARSKSELDWAAILGQHDRWLRTVVYSRVQEPGAVDDVMQEVALAAVRESAPPSDPNKVAAWLYRVAVRQALLYRRACGRRRKLTQHYTEKLPPVEHDTRLREPLDWLLAEERTQRLRDALRRLPQRDAEILMLKYSEDWSYQEIAGHLGVSDSAVEARLHRARRRLREELAGSEDFPVTP
jgi:RNA polymerase sigma-70 factor (ECF subfamily)